MTPTEERLLSLLRAKHAAMRAALTYKGTDQNEHERLLDIHQSASRALNKACDDAWGDGS